MRILLWQSPLFRSSSERTHTHTYTHKREAKCKVILGSYGLLARHMIQQSKRWPASTGMPWGEQTGGGLPSLCLCSMMEGHRREPLSALAGTPDHQSAQALNNQLGNSSLSGKAEEEAEQGGAEKIEGSVSAFVFPLCSTIHQFYMFNYCKYTYTGKMEKNCEVFLKWYMKCSPTEVCWPRVPSGEKLGGREKEEGKSGGWATENWELPGRASHRGVRTIRHCVEKPADGSAVTEISFLHQPTSSLQQRESENTSHTPWSRVRGWDKPLAHKQSLSSG